MLISHQKKDEKNTLNFEGILSYQVAEMLK